MFSDDLQKEKIKKAELSTTARARQKAKEKKAEKAKAEGSAGAPACPPAPCAVKSHCLHIAARELRLGTGCRFTCQ